MGVSGQLHFPASLSPPQKKTNPVYPLNRGGENPRGLSLNIEEYLGSNERHLYTERHKIMKFVITEPTDSVIHKRVTACSYSSRFKDTAYVKVGLRLHRASKVEFSRIRPNSPEEVSSA